MVYIINMDNYITVQDAAERAMVKPGTVRKWIDAGKLPARRVGLRKLYIKEADFIQFCRDNMMVVKDD